MGEQSGREPKRTGSLVRYVVLVLLVLLSLLGQSVAFAAEGTITTTVTINPLLVSVSAPDTVSQGSNFTVTATVENRGETKFLQTVATIHLPKGLSLATGKAEQRINVMNPHTSETVEWTVSADELGTYDIRVSASAKDQATHTLLTAEDTTETEVVVGTSSAAVEVKGSSSPGLGDSIWSAILEFFKVLLTS